MSFAQHKAPTAFKDSDEQLPFPPASAPLVPSPVAELSITPQGGSQESLPGQSHQLWLPPPPVTPTQAPGKAQVAQPQSNNSPVKQEAFLSFLSAPTSGRHTVQLGFTIASLCVIIGGLILVFVHFMALGLPSATSQAESPRPQATHQTVSPATPAVTQAVSPTPTPTPEFPGQQYIDSAQMASVVNGGLPIQTTTDFKVGQQINVTFMVHPAGRNGAVCLLWYLNDKPVTHYSFPVAAYTTPRPASSYAILGGSGNGTVELYWASTTACADKQLAQRLTFNVNQ